MWWCCERLEILGCVRRSIIGLRNCLGRGNLSRFLGVCDDGLQQKFRVLEGFFCKCFRCGWCGKNLYSFLLIAVDGMWNEGFDVMCEIRRDLGQFSWRIHQFLTLVKRPLVRGNWCILISVIKDEKTSCERQFMWLDQWDQVRDNCSKISEILFDQWGQMWETIVVRSVRSCRSVRSSGGLVL